MTENTSPQTAVNPIPFTITLRGLRQPATDGKRIEYPDPLAALDAALAVTDYPQAEPVLTWRDNGDDALDRLAALDVDWHGRNVCGESWLNTVMVSLSPRPVRSWITHGQGLRGIYIAAGDMTAGELAAVAALSAKAWDPGCSVEVKSETRHPAYVRGEQRCGPVKTWEPTTDIAAVGRLISSAASVDEGAVETWLESQGLERGKSYDHASCLIRPGHPSHGAPVYCGDAGIHCKSCEAYGECFPGCSRPGFIPYTRLMGDGVTRLINHLRNAVVGMCHWEHAQHIMRTETGLVGERAKATFGALLKFYHLPKAADAVWRTGGAQDFEKLREKEAAVTEATKKLIARCFLPSKIVRGAGGWVHADDLATPADSQGLSKILSQLPAANYITLEGKAKVSQQKQGELEGGFDLSDAGYPPVIPLRGFDLAEHQRQEDGRVYAVVACKPAFVYWPEAKRDMGLVERVLQDQFPGVESDVLRLIIAAKGCVQRMQQTDPPMVYIVGASGGAKTATVQLAANIACEPSPDGEFHEDRARLLAGYVDGSARCSLIHFDELDKLGIEDSELMRGLLALRPGKAYYRIYRGTRYSFQAGAVILSAVTLPDYFREDRQLARRLVYVNLGAGVNAKRGPDGKVPDWRLTCGSGDVNTWRAWREEWNPLGKINGKPVFAADIANMLVSEVKDRFFCGERRTFHQIAETLKFPVLENAVISGIDLDAAKRRLFYVTCSTQGCEPDGTFQNDTWRVFDYTHESALAEAFRDALNSAIDWMDKKRWQSLKSAGWGQLLNCPGVELDIDRHGRRIGIRFRLGNPRSAEVKYNGDIPIPHGAAIRAAA
jgi:hypothetical protein